MQESVEGVLATAQWDEKMVPQWINEICEKSMKQLMELNRPYKFVGKRAPLSIAYSYLHAHAKDIAVGSPDSPVMHLGKQHRW